MTILTHAWIFLVLLASGKTSLLTERRKRCKICPTRDRFPAALPKDTEWPVCHCGRRDLKLLSLPTAPRSHLVLQSCPLTSHPRSAKQRSQQNSLHKVWTQRVSARQGRSLHRCPFPPAAFRVSDTPFPTRWFALCPPPTPSSGAVSLAFLTYNGSRISGSCV